MRVLNKSLDKFQKPIKYYQTLKNAKTTTITDFKDLKWAVFLGSDFPMRIHYFRDFSEIPGLIAKTIRTFLDHS